ncbi:uncharacterized protein LOC128223188 [Mya arenaria]|uniref:uncharacterized protein LOC128223188 n=1 Tax=Mya arenaria TaxID=6604 RepID=UPI0022E585AB|nr:uncharacterized protein LOC128223188 [Mya arenaria]
MVQLRRKACRELDVKLYRHDHHITRIVAGSKGEGFTTTFESDTDIVMLYNYAVCKTPGDDSLTFPNTHFKFTMDSEHCHPGHFKLELTHTGTTEDSNIQQALFVHDNGKTYVSSEKYRTTFIKDKTQETVSGPAITGCNAFQSWDNVNAFRCTSQQPLLSQWMSRPRHHNWPNPDLIKEVSKLEAQMVPVGCKSSEHKDNEWRVCFILSEQRLTDSWNKNQYRIYILLKLIKKSLLKPISDEISSYLMKNIMLWFTEQNPAKIFKKIYLLQNVISCLKSLQDAIKSNDLPYYMIPDRNLLTGRINPEQQRQLIEKLEELIEEGPSVILRCPKVCAALQMSLVELTKKGCWKDKIEKLYLERMNIRLSYWSPGMTYDDVIQLAKKNPQYNSLYVRINDIVWPQWREYDGSDKSNVIDRKFFDALP